MEWMDRFVSIMNAVSMENEHGVGVTSLAGETGLSKGTLHRILQDMVRCRLIVQMPETKKYHLGPLSMIWGSRFVKGRDISELLAPYCDAIAEKTGLYAYICRFVTNEVYCIYAHKPELEHRTFFVHVGQRMPLHASAASKVILAFQPLEKVRYLMEQAPRHSFTAHTRTSVPGLMAEFAEIQHHKLAWCKEEMEAGVSAVSVPLFSGENAVCFSLNLVGSSLDMESRSQRLEELLVAEGNIIDEQLRAIFTFIPAGGI